VRAQIRASASEWVCAWMSVCIGRIFAKRLSIVQELGNHAVENGGGDPFLSPCDFDATATLVRHKGSGCKGVVMGCCLWVCDGAVRKMNVTYFMTALRFLEIVTVSFLYLEFFVSRSLRLWHFKLL